MSEIIFNDVTIKYISLFEKVTHTRVKDCIERPDILYFIVDAGQLSKAIGKGGSNAKKLRRLFKKNIEIIEYSPKLEMFISNIFHDFKIKEIRIEDRVSAEQKIAYVTVDITQKGKIIGRDSKNLNLARDILNRYTPIEIIIV
jgi:N utilization substance protein A